VREVATAERHRIFGSSAWSSPPAFVALGPAIVAPGALQPGALPAGTVATISFALGGTLVAYIVAQWVLDRRDPKLAEAPARKDDDSVGFE